MPKKKRVCLCDINKEKDGYVSVPTYLFPQGTEYAKEVIPEIKFKKSKSKSK